jgi:hypothetical protein
MFRTRLAGRILELGGAQYGDPTYAHHSLTRGIFKGHMLLVA